MSQNGKTKKGRKRAEMKISPSAKLKQPFLGSHVTTRTNRLIQRGESPFRQPNEAGVDEPPPPIVPPDLGFQLKGKVGNEIFDQCLSQELQDQIRDELENRFQADFENARVLVSCSAQPGRPFLLSIGLWTSPGVAGEQELRNGLNALDILKQGQTAAIFMSSSYIKRQVFQSFKKAPKRFNHDGKEDEDGSVHLTGLTVTLKSPNIVVTKVTGFDDSSVPDVDFTFTVKDTLTAGGGTPRCEDTQSDLNADTNKLFLLGLLSLMLGSILLGLFFLGEAVIAANADFEREEGGAGCLLAGQIPTDIPFEIDPETGFGKLHFIYSQLDVRSAGIFAGGVYLPEPRDPTVSIEGPSTVTIRPETGTKRVRYKFRATDLREPLDIDWSPGKGRQRSTLIFFDINGKPPSANLSQKIRVRIRDADGLEAVDEIIVKIKKLERQGQPL